MSRDVCSIIGSTAGVRFGESSLLATGGAEGFPSGLANPMDVPESTTPRPRTLVVDAETCGSTQLQMGQRDAVLMSTAAVAT
jgi:hypothetical protein